MNSDTTTVRDRALAEVADAVRTHEQSLVALSHSLHAEPETAMQEHRSAAKTASIVEDAGFEVTRGVAGLPTAFVATHGNGDLVVALCAEYDALPDIGHACGHNVNGAASVGAALGLAAVADLLGITVKLVGTPAEEDIGGKALLLEGGVFDDVAAALMAHAAPEDSVGASSLAIGAWDVVYRGRPAHAALAPWEGVNALDAITLAHTAVGLLRQQLPPGTLVHDVVFEAGRAVNVIPDTARARYELRARTTEDLDHARRKVRACLEAAALATGAELELTAHGADFADLRQDEFLTAAYTRAARSLGRDPVDRRGEVMASTDMGNVSHVLPALHPTIGYDTGGAHHHAAPFARAGNSPGADRAVLDAATALAHVGVELATDTEQRRRCLALLADRRRTEAASP
ncbi:amidohydrolase [Streptomyces drozdowiczii]|uniref:Peptidase M20 domain-containing protein 2 n=1 Tax=Streptomyces drozdowiczii TaxID=202862 RepID=A0ABY6Q0K2_9ACTN|nr:amidohydrolase [Streptomyces drozdowiczii]MCX0241925.1 amidohydrolase [Streptomyces drozdowiczii]UZK57963.1 amidohydrolase [Streptomyces drozdowiczii]